MSICSSDFDVPDIPLSLLLALDEVPVRSGVSWTVDHVAFRDASVVGHLGREVIPKNNKAFMPQ